MTFGRWITFFLGSFKVTFLMAFTINLPGVTTPLTFHVDTPNRYLKEIHFSKPSFLVSMSKFGDLSLKLYLKYSHMSHIRFPNIFTTGKKLYFRHQNQLQILQYNLPKTNIAPDWKTTRLPFGARPIFRCENVFRECKPNQLTKSSQIYLPMPT